MIAAAIALMVLAVALSTTTAASAAVPAENRGVPLPPVYLVLDVSGSMQGDKLGMAKQSAKQFTQTLPYGQTFGLYTYPGGKNLVQGCSAGSFVLPPEPFSGLAQTKSALTISDLSADGGTPTGPALREVVKTYEASGSNGGQIVLVTDGEANCGDSDICSIGQELKQKGINLKIHTVSFQITGAGDSALDCLAKSTGGSHFQADDADALIRAIRDSAGYAADIGVDIGSRIPQATGTSLSGTSTMTVNVTPRGSDSIPEAKVVATFKDTTGAGRTVRTSLPVRQLGNLAAGSTRTVSFIMSPSAATTGPITWTVGLYSGHLPVTERTGEVTITTTDDTRSGGKMLAEAQHVVVLGDSYSSGEGAGDYWNADKSISKAYRCHRSSNTYALLLFPEAENIACSGAVTSDAYDANVESLTQYGLQRSDSVPAQLSELRRLALSPESPDLAFMTMGGNDVGFSDIALKCVVSPYCVTTQWTSLRSLVDSSVPGSLSPDFGLLQGKLTNLYLDAASILNTDEALRKRGGKVSQLVVLPYAQGIPDYQNAADGCFGLLSQNESRDLSAFQFQLNQTIKEAVAKAREQSGAVHFASSVAEAFLPDNTICSKDSYLKTSDGAGVMASGLAAKLGQQWTSDAADATSELLHPTAAGHRAISRAIVEWSLNEEPLDTVPAPRRVSVRTTPVLSTHPRIVDIATPLALPVFTPWRPFSEAGDVIDIPWLCAQQQADCTFAPNVPVSVWLHSVPDPGGTLQVNSDGAATPGWALPLSATEGSHRLSLTGVAPDGESKAVLVSVQVARTGANESIYIAAAGVLCLLAAAALSPGRRRPTSTPKESP